MRDMQGTRLFYFLFKKLQCILCYNAKSHAQAELLKKMLIKSVKSQQKCPKISMRLAKPTFSNHMNS